MIMKLINFRSPKERFIILFNLKITSPTPNKKNLTRIVSAC
jgi:hypothetical protein